VEAERWRQIERLFHSALRRAPQDRDALLAEACSGDAELRREVESLLAEHGRGGSLLETAPSDLAADWAQHQHQLTAEQTLGHFRILSPLGKGGMGEVYLAEDLKLRRKVALKLLPSAFTDHEERLRRFEQEARAASALNHPNIITIYEIGEAGQAHFIATEYIEGRTLRALLEEGALPVERVLGIGVQVASALSAAHEAGILHRDIKPENIMLRPDGLVKVLDFGLAKLIRPQPAPLATTTSAAAQIESMPGLIMGTLSYMSPEQAQGLEVDARTDIFSLGAVLYEMAKGRKAFQGNSQITLLAAILERDPEPLPTRVPQELIQVILRCLRKDPARRFQTMADLKAALENVREESASGRQVQAPTRRRWTWAAQPVLLALLLVIGFFAWQAWRAPRDAERLRAVALTTLQGVELYPSLSPDGNHLAFTWTGPKSDNQDIYVQTIGSGSPLRLTADPLSDWNPVWSPDGRWIAFFRGHPLGPVSQSTHELLLIPPLGGPERKLAEVRLQEFSQRPVYLAWSHDSRTLVVTDSTGEGKPDALFVLSIETGEKRRLTNPQPPVIADTSPAISPDGGSLVFRRTATWDAGELYWLPLGKGLIAEGEPTRLTDLELSADYPAWLPNGKEILFAARGELWRLTVPGQHRPVPLPFVGEDGLMPAVSRPQLGGPTRLVYVRSFGDTNIWRIETSAPGAPSSSPPVGVISSTRLDIHAQLSPDGRRLAFTSDRSGAWEIWLADADGANPVPLTSMGARATGGGHWSPDGKWIAFASNREGEFEIYRVPSSGGKPVNLTSHPAFDHSPSFSSDGKWIYFSSTRTGAYEIWKIPASGGEAVRVTTNGGFRNAESPDGAYIYYSPADTLAALWRLPTSGGPAVKVVDGIVWWNFRVLQRGIYYIDQPAGETRLQFFDFATRRSTTVARGLGNVDAGLTATADGRTILFTRVDASFDDLMLVENLR
jgi:serine/threonine protein kinase/Tol biopolymer transport system component